MQVLVVNVGAPYDFKTEAGQQLKGFKVNYIPLEAGVSNPDFFGKVIVSKSYQPEFRSSFERSKVPGIYDFDIVSGYTASGKITQICRSITYKREPKIEDLK